MMTFIPNEDSVDFFETLIILMKTFLILMSLLEILMTLKILIIKRKNPMTPITLISQVMILITILTIMRTLIRNCGNEESIKSNKNFMTILPLIDTLMSLIQTPMSLIKTALILMRVINIQIFLILTRRDSKTCMAFISNGDFYLGHPEGRPLQEGLS